MLFLPVVIGDAATRARSRERQLHQALVSRVMDPCRIPNRASAAARHDITLALWSGGALWGCTAKGRKGLNVLAR